MTDALIETLAERRRLGDAMVAVVGDRGYEATTVELVIQRAGLQHDDFAHYFASRRDCLQQIYVERTAEAIGFVKGAFYSEKRWRDGLRSALRATLCSLRVDPLNGRFLLLDAPAAGDVTRVHRDLMIAEFVDLVDAGRHEREDPEAVSRTMAEVVVGALHRTMLAIATCRELRPDAVLVRELMYVAVMPYLGARGAREELGDS
jgi:AcrR family transcriptional regulator